MKIRKLWSRTAAFLAVFLLYFSFTFSVLADENMDTDREASLTISFGQEEEGLFGAAFRIYRVAEMSAEGQFTLTGDFVEYPVAVNDLDSSGWRALAQTLDGYVTRDGLEPFQMAETDHNGRAVFEGLPIGLYLIMGDTFQKGDMTCTPEPFLICLPGFDQESGQWLYDVAASCKYDSIYHPPGGGDDKIQRKVLKVWDDKGNEEERPKEIVVQLLKDGEIFDTVTLNEGNNWRYTWRNLDGGCQWRVTEKETPKNYTVSVDRQGITFVMTNTNVDKPSGGTGGGGQSTGSRLPQTGMLWWPVPILAMGGLLLFLIGWSRRRYEA